ncbi:MAG TPA: ABC transporter substrate-binding protein, partial [Clostridium sp.]|nr:ABC transporter substrate-binding protein [Clostridium sp.]
MRKQLTLFLALILSMGILGGCGKKDSAPSENGSEEKKTDYRFEQ